MRFARHIDQWVINAATRAASHHKNINVKIKKQAPATSRFWPPRTVHPAIPGARSARGSLPGPWAHTAYRRYRRNEIITAKKRGENKFCVQERGRPTAIFVVVVKQLSNDSVTVSARLAVECRIYIFCRTRKTKTNANESSWLWQSSWGPKRP